MTAFEAHAPADGIAIIGMAGSFPGAANVEQLWHNLCAGAESITFFSDEELIAAGEDPQELGAPGYVKAAAICDDIDLFDAEFFGVSAREAELTNPQHRVLLERAWEALEHAGYDPKAYPGRIGVFAGGGMNQYLWRNVYGNAELMSLPIGYQAIMRNGNDFLTTYVSYQLSLRGPSVAVQTACSTSLVAVHLACSSLLNGECDMALAGGVRLNVPQRAGYRYQEGGIHSSDGHCRPFDARAEGIVSGNGAGLVVLKPLEDALAARDTIYAVIRGSAINNDGALKAGYTAPSVQGQVEVIRAAHALAEVDPETITYVEAHGTGTPLGDPIEVAALTQAFRTSSDKRGYCAIGSVKSNMGHLDAAAGVLGLIKTALALHHRLIPPSLHVEQPNPAIDFAGGPFRVNTELLRWERGAHPLRAGVSSFGIGGTNAHAVLEEAPPAAPPAAARPWQLLPLSAKTGTALEAMAVRLAARLEQEPRDELADIAYTLQVGRQAFGRRRFVVARDAAEAREALARSPGRAPDVVRQASERSIVYLFSGQGAQYPNMGRELYDTEPVFREQFDRCAELLLPQLGRDIRSIIYPAPDQLEAASAQLNHTVVTQPALFAIEYALAKLWTSWGVRPQAVIGHSVGEYAAACVAGILSLEDALALLAARGELIQQLPGGSMLAVPLSEAALRPLLGDELSLAAVNGPERCVASGPAGAVSELEQRLAAQGVASRRLHTSHAFHSQMLEPALEPFLARVRRVSLKPPRIPLLSNVTGTWLTASEAQDPGYWTRHLRETVRFGAGLEELWRGPERVLLEVGPGRTLQTLARQHSACPAEQLVLPSLRHPAQGIADGQLIMTTLGQLWQAGVEVDWQKLSAHERRRRVPLPSYPFERKRYWSEPTARPLPAPPEPAAQEDATQAKPATSMMEEVVARQLALIQQGRDLMARQLEILSAGATDSLQTLSSHDMESTNR